MNTNISNWWKGIIAGVLSAACFSSKAIFVKLSYEYGVDSTTLLMLRMLTALPFYLMVAVVLGYQGRWKPFSRHDWGLLVMLGLLGYYLASLFDFMGLQYISASLERIILFAYPALVLVLGWLFFRQKITGVQHIALALTYGGILLVMLQPGLGDVKGQYWLGVMLVFLSAFTYAIYLLGGGKLIPRLGSVPFTTAALIISSIAVIIHAFVMHREGWTPLHPKVIEYGIWMGVVSTFIPTYLINYSIRQLGASNASLVASLGPVTTIGLAYLILDERMTGIQWMGSFFVIVGVVFISIRGK